MYQKYCDKLRQSLNLTDKAITAAPESIKVIPQFYFKLPKNNNDNSINFKFREESRTLFLQKRSRELLDNGELKELWSILEKNYTVLLGDDQYISYDDYKNKVMNVVSEKSK